MIDQRGGPHRRFYHLVRHMLRLGARNGGRRGTNCGAPPVDRAGGIAGSRLAEPEQLRRGPDPALGGRYRALDRPIRPGVSGQPLLAAVAGRPADSERDRSPPEVDRSAPASRRLLRGREPDRMAYDHIDSDRLSTTSPSAQALRDRSILSTLFAGLGGDRADTWAEALVAEYGSLPAALTGSRRRTLPAVDGSSPAVDLLAAVHRCHLDLLARPVTRRGSQVTAELIVPYLQSLMGSARTEAFQAVFVDREQRLIAAECMFRGGRDVCYCDVGTVALRAVDLGAAALIVAHNHPSGDPSPSKADYEMTRELANACSLFGIRLIDHFVIADGGFTSFRAHGLL